MPITDIQLAQLTTPCVPSIVPPALQTRLDRINGTRPGAIAQPLLRFTDLISGPATGLGDGLGSGVIVTVWGQGFGDTPGEVFYTDSLGVERPAAHIYYWKRADGQLPGGPADLWRSHLMYEVAFSIPAGSADGVGSIRIRKAGAGAYSINTLPFTVRAGRILWVAPTGNNTNVGTFASPKEYVNARGIGSSGLGNFLQAGDTVYSRGVIEVPETPTSRDALYIRGAAGSLAQQIMLVNYPGTRSEIQGYEVGFQAYSSRGCGLSKYKVMAGAVAPTPDGSLILGAPSNSHCQINQDGRYVGLEITDIPGTCSTGQAGCFVSTFLGADNTVMLGNWIHDIGCDGTSHFQHTTYISSRSGSVVNAPTMSFNFLENCKAKYGIHIYDQRAPTGEDSQFVGTIRVQNNVIVGQKGAGINIRSVCPTPSWTANGLITNNILIEVGKGPVQELNNGTSPEGVNFGGNWLPPSIVFEGNIIYIYSDESSRLYGPESAIQIDFLQQPAEFVLSRNIIVSDGDFVIYKEKAGNVSVPTEALNNAFYSLSASNTKTLPSSWTGNIENQNLLFNFFQVLLDVQLASPLVKGVAYRDPYDFYGRSRYNQTVGPVEAV